MPLVKREIEPVHVSRVPVAQGVQNELEYMTNSSLANVIRQLSSLAHHAEDMFAELASEAMKFHQRTDTLHRRIETLRVKVTQLDSTGEEGIRNECGRAAGYASINFRAPVNKCSSMCARDRVCVCVP